MAQIKGQKQPFDFSRRLRQGSVSWSISQDGGFHRLELKSWLKIRDPIRFSEHYGIDATWLEDRGVLDPTLNADTKLFIDPLLLANSSHTEISSAARSSYEAHFGTIIKFLAKAKNPTDVAWKSAARLLTFPEIKWTCLGYGAQSVSGSGSGSDMTGQYIETARQIVELGIEDPDLFVAMALFENGVGPDRIWVRRMSAFLQSRIKRALKVKKLPRSTLLTDRAAHRQVNCEP